MKLKNFVDTLRVELRKASTYVRTALLIALPWAGEIRDTVNQHLPALQPYLPENVYKFMGAAVVVTGIVLSLVNSHRAVKAANDA